MTPNIFFFQFPINKTTLFCLFHDNIFNLHDIKIYSPNTETDLKLLPFFFIFFFLGSFWQPMLLTFYSVIYLYVLCILLVPSLCDFQLLLGVVYCFLCSCLVVSIRVVSLLHPFFIPFHLPLMFHSCFVFLVINCSLFFLHVLLFDSSILKFSSLWF